MSLPACQQCDKHFRHVDTQLGSRLLSLTHDLDGDTDATTIFGKSRDGIEWRNRRQSHSDRRITRHCQRGNQAVQAVGMSQTDRLVGL